MSRSMPHVALLIETSREYGRGLLRGVIRYLREHGPWSLYFRPKGLGEPPPVWLETWHGDGILVRADNRPLAEAVVRSRLPAVELRWSFPDLDLPAVGIDNRAVVALAVDHLRERGFRDFGFCGLPARQNIVVDFRQTCFAEQVRAIGGTAHVFPARRGRQSGAWEREQEEIVRWLAGLPKPVGVMAGNDDRGLQVLDACRRAGLQVPDEVAVIGVDNDEFLCNLSSPPLTSVDVGVERAGYEAAALLDQLMAGKKPPGRKIFLEPLGVVVRQSTDVLAVPDPELAAVVRFIRAHACEGIRVDDALSEVACSRSTIQRRFRAVVGRSPKAEIMRVQLEQARRLLAQTDLPIAEVARRCGFAELKRLSSVFRAKVGVSPAAYRRQAKKPASG